MNPFGAHRFYEVLGLWEVQVLTALRRRVAPLKKGLTCVGDLSWLGSYEDLVNVSRILALGGSICRVLRRVPAKPESLLKHSVECASTLFVLSVESASTLRLLLCRHAGLADS